MQRLGILRLEGVRLRSARNVLRRGGRPLLLLVAAGLVLLLAFLYGEYRFFLAVFRKMEEIPFAQSLPGARFFVIGVLERLHNMVFLTALSMLLFSNVLTGIGTTYLATDLDLLHTMPMRRGAIFAARIFETMLLSSYMVWLVTLPLFVAFGSAFGSGVRTGLWSSLVLLLYAVPPAALGGLAALLLVRFVPARRAHQVMTGLGVLGAVMLVVLLRALRPERLLNPGGTDDLMALLQSIAIPSSAAMPSTWATTAVVASLQALVPLYVRETVKLALLGVLLVIPLALVADGAYFPAFSRAAEGARQPGSQAGRRFFDRFLERLFARATLQGRALYRKDVRVFARDSIQWSQLLLIAALIFIYLFNIKNLPYVQEFPWLRIFVCYLNLGLTGFILAAIAVRYAYPAVSLEGQAFWVVRSSPIDYRRFLASKFMLHLIPFLGLAEALVISGNLLLGTDRFLLLLSVGATALMTMGLTGLGVGLGAMMPKFRFESPAQIAAGLGGVTYMVLALGFIAIVLLLLFVPTYQHLVRLFPDFALVRLQPMSNAPFYAATALFSLATASLPLGLGLKRLRVPGD